MVSNVYDDLKRLLPGFSIYENAEYIGIVHPNDTAVELKVEIKKMGSIYYLFATHRGSTLFYTSVSNSNEATVGAYFLVDKHLRCYPKPLHKHIRKAVLYYHKELSKKMSCPPSLETIENLFMEIWELL